MLLPLGDCLYALQATILVVASELTRLGAGNCFDAADGTALTARCRAGTGRGGVIGSAQRRPCPDVSRPGIERGPGPGTERRAWSTAIPASLASASEHSEMQSETAYLTALG